MRRNVRLPHYASLGGNAVKIAAAFVAVIIALLGIIAGIGHLDGSITFGEPTTDVAPTDVAPIDGASPITGPEQSYLEFAVGSLQTVSNDIYTLGTLFSQPAMDDPQWQSSVTALLRRIEVGYDAIATLEPTPRLQSFQDAAMLALGHSAEFARMLRELLIQGQTDLSEEAAAELVAAANAFGQTEDLLNEFLATHPPAEQTE